MSWLWKAAIKWNFFQACLSRPKMDKMNKQHQVNEYLHERIHSNRQASQPIGYDFTNSPWEIPDKAFLIPILFYTSQFILELQHQQKLKNELPKLYCVTNRFPKLTNTLLICNFLKTNYNKSTSVYLNICSKYNTNIYLCKQLDD